MSPRQKPESGSHYRFPAGASAGMGRSLEMVVAAVFHGIPTRLSRDPGPGPVDEMISRVNNEASNGGSWQPTAVAMLWRCHGGFHMIPKTRLATRLLLP